MSGSQCTDGVFSIVLLMTERAKLAPFPKSVNANAFRRRASSAVRALFYHRSTLHLQHLATW